MYVSDWTIVVAVLILVLDGLVIHFCFDDDFNWKIGKKK